MSATTSRRYLERVGAERASIAAVDDQERAHWPQFVDNVTVEPITNRVRLHRAGSGVLELSVDDTRALANAAVETPARRALSGVLFAAAIEATHRARAFRGLIESPGLAQ